MLLLCALVALMLSLPRPTSAQWRPGGMPVCTAPMNQEYPMAIEDGHGGAFIAWRDQRDSAATGYDIYAQRIDANGVAQWTTNGVPVCTLTGNQISPYLTADGAGGVIIAWEDLRSGTRYQIYAQRLSPTGARLWGAGGVLLRDYGLSQYLDGYGHPSIAADGAGGAIVAWEESVTGTDEDLYAQRIDVTGAPLWTPGRRGRVHRRQLPGLSDAGCGRSRRGDHRLGGLALLAGGPCLRPAPNQNYPAVVADDAGGAMVAWNDHRGPGGEIYVQRLDSLGAPQWTVDGVPLTGGMGGISQGAPIAVPDETGGAIVAWNEWRDGYCAKTCTNGD